jgi:hypothetical protein
MCTFLHGVTSQKTLSFDASVFTWLLYVPEISAMASFCSSELLLSRTLSSCLLFLFSFLISLLPPSHLFLLTFFPSLFSFSLSFLPHGLAYFPCFLPPDLAFSLISFVTSLLNFSLSLFLPRWGCNTGNTQRRIDSLMEDDVKHKVSVKWDTIYSVWNIFEIASTSPMSSCYP